MNNDFTRAEKIEVLIRQDLADRLPKEKAEKNAFINLAVEHELDGRKSAASIMGAAKSEKKTVAARENAKKPRKRHIGGFNSIYCYKDGKVYMLRLTRDDKEVETYNAEINRMIPSIERGNYRIVVCPDGGGQYNADIQPEPGTIPDIQELAKLNGFEPFDIRDFPNIKK
ncbi:MAG: hypothetical protein FWC97_07940 [Treponema sp.]|nr:hypothetical protein [Treponema sp.]